MTSLRGLTIKSLCTALCMICAFAVELVHASSAITTDQHQHSSTPVTSYQIDGATFKTSASTQLKQVGMAEFSYLFWDVYDSYLFNHSGKIDPNYTWYEQAPLVLEIRYKRDIKADELIDSTIEQWQHLNLKADQYEAYVPWLKKVWPNLKKGDRLALLVQDGQSVFFYNQQELARQPDPYFARIFLDIWLSPDTSEPKLRKKLLGIK
ncbi:chalcone isomerase family protein [Psychrosphaera ytuae]|uniref:Chalcone isomerase family protein n=1 Tax=Psychrosphaera ytuae TaxID=2820710 RepID=A0A975HH94_9GAMM|nr:chalcone isomerase family protein [Psychrosphaera ytuae]QTH62865.1 chalcone isomerase family protein [Psychrosphaera ytuae]